MRARQPEVPLVALARAMSLADDDDARRDVLRMLRKVEEQRDQAVDLKASLVTDLSSLIA